jgi:hypothetical protein
MNPVTLALLKNLLVTEGQLHSIIVAVVNSLISGAALDDAAMATAAAQLHTSNAAAATALSAAQPPT